ncbi:MAG: transglutaminase domain-containing protein [Nanoarchaeota archaeon]|nr:transglutaminase domain-containing protein [Nanoarchaeota archaeon]
MNDKKLIAILFLVTILLIFVIIFGVIALEDIKNIKESNNCDKDQGILSNESKGQVLLDNFLNDIKKNLTKLEARGNFSIEDKILYVRNQVFLNVHFLKEDNSNKSLCYSQFYTVNNSYWGSSHFCLRRQFHPNPNFTMLYNCGKCGEAADLLYYLLNELGIKTRIVSVPSGDHAFNEVYLNGSWKSIDASIDTFNFDTYQYENFYIRVEKGEGLGEDLTNKYLKEQSFKNWFRRQFFKIRLFFVDLYI